MVHPVPHRDHPRPGAGAVSAAGRCQLGILGYSPGVCSHCFSALVAQSWLGKGFVMTDWHTKNSDGRLYSLEDFFTYTCPMCGKECDTVFVIKNTGHVVGCDQCISEWEPCDIVGSE